MSLSDLINEFTTIVDEIFRIHEKKSVVINNIMHEHYKNYKIMLSKINAEEHAEFFLSPFKKNKFAILADKSDAWIRDGQAVIQFNEGAKKVNPKFRIHLSNVYNVALKLAKEAKEAFSQMIGGKMSIEELYPEIKFPDMLLYSYYKLIKYYLTGPTGNDQKDLDTLSGIIAKYEQHLGIHETKEKSGKQEEDSDPKGREQGRTGSSPPDYSGVINTDSIGKMFSMATNAMQQSGIKLPDNVKLPSGDEFSSILNGIFTNPQVQSVFNGLMKSMEGAKSPQEALSKAAQNLASKDLTSLASSITSGSGKSGTDRVKEEDSKDEDEEDQEGEITELTVAEGTGKDPDEGKDSDEGTGDLVQFD